MGFHRSMLVCRQIPLSRTDFSSGSDVVVGHCAFAVVSGGGKGNPSPCEGTIGLSLTDSVLTNCTGQADGGGVYCQFKAQVLPNSCFLQCTTISGNTSAVRLSSLKSRRQRIGRQHGFHLSHAENMEIVDVAESRFWIHHKVTALHRKLKGCEQSYFYSKSAVFT